MFYKLSIIDVENKKLDLKNKNSSANSEYSRTHLWCILPNLVLS